MTSTLISLTAWALLMSIASVASRGATGLLCLLAGIGPFCLGCWHLLKLDARKRHALKVAAGIIDIDRARFAHFEAASGLVLDPDQRQLTVSCDTLAKRYAYGDIREWQMNPQTRELRLWMRDAEHPVWHVAMDNDVTRARWADCLRQLVDEGRAPPPKVRASDYAAH